MKEIVAAKRPRQLNDLALIIKRHFLVNELEFFILDFLKYFSVVVMIIYVAAIIANLFMEKFLASTESMFVSATVVSLFQAWVLNKIKYKKEPSEN